MDGHMDINTAIISFAALITAIATVVLALFNKEYIKKIAEQNIVISEQLMISRKSFLKSLEPSLLLIATNGDPKTMIRYINTSSNTFYDLNIYCIIEFSNQTLDYSWLFDRDMYMAPKDDRIRQYNLLGDLQKRGFDIKDFASKGNEVLLSLSFSYTFGEEKKEYKVQQYKWEVETNSWAIK